MNAAEPQKKAPAPGAVLRAWFSLTPQERLALALIAGLFLLGLGARYWHLSREPGGVDAATTLTRLQPGR